jgi:hypothetical protein
MSVVDSEEYEQGRKAHAEGIKYNECPYESSKTFEEWSRWFRWSAGWNDAQEKP